MRDHDREMIKAGISVCLRIVAEGLEACYNTSWHSHYEIEFWNHCRHNPRNNGGHIPHEKVLISWAREQLAGWIFQGVEAWHDSRPTMKDQPSTAPGWPQQH